MKTWHDATGADTAGLQPTYTRHRATPIAPAAGVPTVTELALNGEVSWIFDKHLIEFKNEVAEEAADITKDGIEDGAQLVEDLCIRFTGGTDLAKVLTDNRHEEFICRLWAEPEVRLQAFRQRVNDRIGFDYDSSTEDGSPESEAVDTLLYQFGANGDLAKIKACDREDFVASLPDAIADAVAEAEEAAIPRDYEDDRRMFEVFKELSDTATDPEKKIRYLAQAYIQLDGGVLSPFKRAEALARARQVLRRTFSG